MRNLINIAAVWLLVCGSLYAQSNTDQSLAIQFYQNQEYDRAAEMFDKLYNKDPNSDLYYRYLYNSLMNLKEFEKLEKIVKKRVKKNPEDISTRIDLGYLYQQSGAIEDGQKEFEGVLKDLPANQHSVRTVANTFLGYGELELAARVYEKGKEQIRIPGIFSMELADIYTRSNNKKEAISNYLDYVQNNPNNLQTIKNKLQDGLADDAFFEELQTQLLGKIQRTSDILFSELLIWQFIQVGDYTSAFIQARALDKRGNENGFRVINLARAAAEEHKYDAAIQAYTYVIDKGRTNSLYQTARQELLALRKKRVTDTYNYTPQDLSELLSAYNGFLEEFGISRYTINTLLEKASLQAYYLHNLEEAITTMEAILKLPQIDKSTRATAKLELGDYYLLKGEDWEASLLYSQVDKDMGDEPLGELARYKNAKLSYYQGEFEWSQAQLNILKASTSELIANDALELAVFIMDNYGLDTTLYPMETFAKADLLLFQNKLDEALATFDSVSNVFPNHSLADDIAYRRAKIYLKKQEFTKAAEYLQLIIDRHGEDLLGDNATFELAELYERQLNDKEKAMTLYQDLILNYHDSVLVVEARKRFRKLRGDEL